MAEILSSIRRIIADDDQARLVEPGHPDPDPTAREGEPQPADVPSQPVPLDDDDEDILRLTNRIDLPPQIPATPLAAPSAPAPEPELEPTRAPALVQPPRVPPGPRELPAAHGAGLILSYGPSVTTAEAFSTLNTALNVRETIGQDNKTVDDLLRELMLPLLRQWMDANLPGLVERLVSEEIARVTGQDADTAASA